MTHSDDRENRKYVNRILSAIERSEFNIQFRGAQSEQFREAFESGLIHDLMLNDALGHPVAFRALVEFLKDARPGSFDSADAESDDWPQISPQGRAEQERYNSIVTKVFREYVALDSKERAQRFGLQPSDLEPNLPELLEKLDSDALTVSQLLNELTSG